jgi:hypothetical protein
MYPGYLTNAAEIPIRPQIAVDVSNFIAHFE